MVFLAISPAGLSEAIALANGSPVWCSAEAITEEEFERLESGNVTRLSYEISDQGREVLNEALATIREHHPQERIWIEGDGDV